MTQRTAGMKAGGSRFSSFKQGAISMETPHQKQTIIIIAIIAVVVIAGLFFIGSRVVGQAINLPDSVFAVGEGGFEAPIALPKSAGDLVTLQVGARLPDGKSSVAYSFTIEYPDDALEFVDIDSKLLDDWGDDFIRTIGPEDSTHGIKKVTFDHATLNYPKAIIGGKRLAEVNFKVKKELGLTAEDVAKVKITDLDVLSLSDDADLVDVPPESEVIRTNEICVAWLSNLQSLSDADKTRLCIGSTTTASGGLSVDLDGIGGVGNTELFLIKLSLFAKDSEPQPNCGGQGQSFCHFADQGYYMCENLEFIKASTGSPAEGQVCGGMEHITGGSTE